jgi:hypothetical protein
MESGANPEQSGYCDAENFPICHCLRREGGKFGEAESGYMLNKFKKLFSGEE